MDEKLSWQGFLLAIQPRIRLTRSFDESSHSYLGYVLRVDGEIGDQQREFLIGIGKAAQAKHQLRVGDFVSGLSAPVADSRKEVTEFYKTSQLKVVERSKLRSSEGPPWLRIVPDLSIYRERGHRRLDKKTYQAKCTSCMWGCHMAVELIIDPWKPNIAPRYRTETFCYGPLSCPYYKAGPKRTAPGRHGMRYEEEDWVDEEATSHRGPDD